VDADIDSAVRVAAFDFLKRQSDLHGGQVLSRRILAEGFSFGGDRVPLLGPQGIFKPAVCELPLSMTTVPAISGKARPYEDEFAYDGIRYRYRGTDPKHSDNAGLRRAMREQIPLIYFHGHQPGLYHAEWPVYVVRDDPDNLTFTILTGEMAVPTSDVLLAEPPRRAYLARLMLQRLHQTGFRVQVLAAYREMCAVCSLRHSELLDAAHILPDMDPRGEPIVPNGVALCRLHHSAFDADILGIRPDHTIDIRRDVLEETDGPMLQHGLQGFDRERITVPRSPAQQPNPEFLAERYARFKKAG
jgi:putative restriction endonuclease